MTSSLAQESRESGEALWTLCGRLAGNETALRLALRAAHSAADLHKAIIRLLSKVGLISKVD